MSSYISARLRRQVLARDHGTCAYCRCTEGLMGITFEVDHIIPESAGGVTKLDNLCLACPVCNRAKAARLVAIDYDTDQEVPFFHPLTDNWVEHFVWMDNGAIVVGKTPTGRATIEALRMNRPSLVQLRRYWIVLELHPPI